MSRPLDRFLFFALMPLVLACAGAIFAASPLMLFSGLIALILPPVGLLVLAYSTFRIASAVALLGLWGSLVGLWGRPKGGQPHVSGNHQGLVVAGVIVAPLEALVAAFNLRGQTDEGVLTMGAAIGAMVAFVVSGLLIVNFGHRAPDRWRLPAHAFGWRLVLAMWVLIGAAAAGGFAALRPLMRPPLQLPTVVVDANSSDPIAQALCAGDEAKFRQESRRSGEHADLGAILARCLRAPDPADPARQLEFPERLPWVLALLEMQDHRLGKHFGGHCTPEKAAFLDHAYTMDVKVLSRFGSRGRRIDCAFRTPDGQPLWWQVITRPGRSVPGLDDDLAVLDSLDIPWTERNAEGLTLLDADEADEGRLMQLPSRPLAFLADKTAPSHGTRQRLAVEAMRRRFLHFSDAAERAATEDLVARVGEPERDWLLGEGRADVAYLMDRQAIHTERMAAYLWSRIDPARRLDPDQPNKEERAMRAVLGLAPR
jgi:hypothetical protein